MSMNQNEIRATARQMTIEAIMPSMVDCDPVKFADGSFAILQRVDTGEGVQEVWTEVTIKSKNWKDTKRAKAFDPYEEEAAWKAEREIKKQEKMK